MFRLFFLFSMVLSFNLSRREVLSSVVSSSPIMFFENKNLQNETTKMYENDRSIYFYSDVTDESCFWLTRNLEKMAKESDIPVHLHIQSTGGSLIPTFNVVDTIIRLPIDVYTYIDGFAASAASLISVVGKGRYMGKHSLILLHQLSSSSSEGTYGNMKDHTQNLDTFMEFIREIYLDYSKLDEDFLNELLSHDIWLNSSTALKYGLIDGII